MATIQSSLKLYDGMTGPLRAISNAMNITISTFESMQTASEHALDVAALQSAREELARVNVSVDQMERSIQMAGQSQDKFNKKMQDGNGIANGLGMKIKQFVGAYAGIQGIRMAVNFVSDTISLQNVQNEAETKLESIMRQRMGASPAEIQSVKALTAAQQGLGVVGDEVQLSGAQQLATFLSSTDALNTLIPAMNNLAVQQNGVNVSTQDAIGIGNMMGKVMQGQVSALTRVGVTFDAAQEKILKYGNEQERAATLAEVITNNVSNMNAIMAATPQGQIQQMANTWGDIKETVGAKLYPAVMSFFTALNSNMPQAEKFLMGIAGGLNVVITVLSWLISGAGAVVGVFQDNWPVIEPVIWGIIGALIVYNAVMGIGWLTTLKNAAALAWKTICDWAETAAIIAMIVAQDGLNAALLACPITWIIIGIIALIAIIYSAVAAVNKWKGTTISATGIIAGTFAVLGAHIINTFIIPTWNMIAALVNFFYNAWNDLAAAVKILFLDMANSVIGYMSNMAHTIEDIINRIPGVHVDITSGLDSFKSKIEDTAAKVKSEAKWKEIVSAKDFIDYGDAAKAGYKFGQGIDSRVSGLFDGSGDFGMGGGAQGAWEGINENAGNTAGNTAKMADSMDVMDEELKYMRDAAEQEIINRFTLAELKVDVKNNNTLTKKTDFDDMGRALAAFTGEFLASAAEGGHI
ncbi:hypothetical protein [Enterocloster clostridioformis]|uniref:hypothetical protein n=1 Tax=Enterocloster clostridioformis TaxID=1531 RepID=UPI00040F6425|nr:hypothetical protein [Enterocloster clostridioformis]